MSTSVATTPVPISIFDETDSLVAIVGLYESAFFERDWQTAGTFQITINLNIPSASEFKRGRTVLFGQDRRRFGIIIETIDNIDEKGKGNEKRTVYGYEIKKILDWRMVQPPAGSDYFHYNTFAETVMHNLVKYNADPSFVTDTLRGFYRGDTVALGAMLVQESDQGRGPTYLLNSRWNTTILEELAACALATGWGSWIEFNAVGGAGFNWIFRTSGGVDRTASQSVNNRVIFNTDYGTLRTAQATDSDVTYKSLAYVGGQGQGAARTIRTVYDGASAPTSRLRKEMFVDARDLSANADLDSRGALKLSQNYFQIFLDASSLAVSSVVFGIDYDLGDTCTVTQFGMSVDEQITKVRESWSANSYQVDLTFDRKYAEITSLVKSNNTTLQTALSASEVPALVGGYALVSDTNQHTVESTVPTETLERELQVLPSMRCDIFDYQGLKYYLEKIHAKNTNIEVGAVVAYANGATVVAYGYVGGVYSPTQNRIYLVPYSQSNQTDWHYIDCATGAVVAYANGATVVANGYIGGVYSPTQNRIYLVPLAQSSQTNWHYILEFSSPDVAPSLMASPMFNKL